MHNVGIQQNTDVTGDFHRTHNIPDISRTPGSPWIVFGSGKRRRRERKQKRGCRLGLLARLKRQPHKPPLPSIFLSNAITHKIDHLELQLAAETTIRDCGVLLITETWLHPLITDDAVQLAGRTTHRQDRSKESGKSKGGGLCVYVHNDWCANSRIIHTHCSPDLQALSVVCRPFYLQRELTAVIITAVSSLAQP